MQCYKWEKVGQSYRQLYLFANPKCQKGPQAPSYMAGNPPSSLLQVSRPVKATLLVSATATVLGTQDAINICWIQWEVFLNVTDLISLKSPAKAPSLEARWNQNYIALRKLKNICLGLAQRLSYNPGIPSWASPASWRLEHRTGTEAL